MADGDGLRDVSQMPSLFSRCLSLANPCQDGFEILAQSYLENLATSMPGWSKVWRIWEMALMDTEASAEFAFLPPTTAPCDFISILMNTAVTSEILGA